MLRNPIYVAGEKSVCTMYGRKNTDPLMKGSVTELAELSFVVDMIGL